MSSSSVTVQTTAETLTAFPFVYDLPQLLATEDALFVLYSMGATEQAAYVQGGRQVLPLVAIRCTTSELSRKR